MKHKTKFMFDTVAFNRVVECDVFDSLYNKKLLIYATHAQRDEINNTKNLEKKSQLLRVFCEIPENYSNRIGCLGLVEMERS